MILHVTRKADWERATAVGEHRAESLASEGFIHCSTEYQVARSANRHFAGRTDLVVLLIDPVKLRSPLIHEPASSGEIFPHVHGPVNVEAVIKAVPYLMGMDGRFGSPNLG